MTNRNTALEIIEAITDELIDATNQDILNALEDGQALATLGFDDEDQEAIEEAHFIIKARIADEKQMTDTKELCTRYAELDAELIESVKTGDKDRFNKVDKEMCEIGQTLWDRHPEGFYKFAMSGERRSELFKFLCEDEA